MSDVKVVGAYESVNGSIPLAFIRPGQFVPVDRSAPIAREGILHDYRTQTSVAISVMFVRDGFRQGNAGDVMYDRAAPNRAERIRSEIAQRAAS